MNVGSVAWLFAVSIGASALGGALGMASGIFIVPILTLLFGIDIHIAVGASLVSVIACSCGSAAPFLEERLTNIRLAVVLETATTLGALTGVFLIGIIPTAYLYLLVRGHPALSAQQMLARRREPANAMAAPASRSWATVLRLHSSAPDRIDRTATWPIRSAPCRSACR